MTILKFLSQKLKTVYPQTKIYLVGGSVRDKILKRQLQDIDLVITGIPARDLEKILNQLGTTKLVGKSFGVYKWKPKDTSLYPSSRRDSTPDNASFEEGRKGGVEIDIALPRTETGWGTGGRRDFDTQTNPFLLIEEDLKRRDFTINSIAFDITTQKYIDPFGGQKDIQKKIIRTIGKPEERLKEDVSRILRAIRLACSLNFKIEQRTWSVIKKLAPQITKVTKEITASEITQSFCRKPTLALRLFDKSGILEILIPEIRKMKTCKQPKIWHSEGNVFTHTQLALQALEKKQKPPFDPILVFGLLWHDIGKTVTRKKQKGKITFYNHQNKGLPLAQRIIKRLKLESAGVDKEQVKWLIQNHMVIFSAKDINKIKNTTLEKYFLSDKFPSQHLLTIIECDADATIPLNVKKQEKNRQNISLVKKRIKLIRVRPKKPLLNGDEVMAVLKIGPGHQVGKILQMIREVELKGEISTKKEAEEFIKVQSSKRKVQSQITV